MKNIAVSFFKVFEPGAKAIPNTKIVKGRICSLKQISSWKRMSSPITCKQRHKLCL